MSRPDSNGGLRPSRGPRHLPGRSTAWPFVVALVALAGLCGCSCEGKVEMKGNHNSAPAKIDLKAGLKDDLVTDAEFDDAFQLKLVPVSQRPAVVALRELNAKFDPISDGEVRGVNLFGTNIADSGMKHLEKLTALRFLHVDSPLITDASMTFIQSLADLEHLNLNGTQIGDAGLRHLKGLTKLKRLGMTRTKITDSGLQCVNSWPNLGAIQLEGTQISDRGLEMLAGLTNLELLYLKDTKVTNAGLVHLKGLTRLRQLWLTGTPISDAGLVHLAGLTQLDLLDLEDTSITDAGLDHLRPLTNLNHLWIRNTKVTAVGLAKLRQVLSNCEIHSTAAK